MFACLLPTGIAQKVLLLEKAGSVKSKRFYAGEELTLRFAEDPAWHTVTIAAILPEDSILVLDRQYVKLHEIEAIKTFKNRRWSRTLGNQFYVFGASWLAFTAGDEIASARNSADWEAAAWVSGTSIATGWLVQRFFRWRAHRMGEKYRLRMLDLTPVSPPR
jgi:hypothetical protein